MYSSLSLDNKHYTVKYSRNNLTYFKIVRNDPKPKRFFLHHIATGDEKLVHYGNLKNRKLWRPSMWIFKPNIHRKNLVVYLLGSAWSRVLWATQTELNHHWGSFSKQLRDWSQHPRKNNLSTAPHTTNLFSGLIMFVHI